MDRSIVRVSVFSGGPLLVSAAGARAATLAASAAQNGSRVEGS